MDHAYASRRCRGRAGQSQGCEEYLGWTKAERFRKLWFPWLAVQHREALVCSSKSSFATLSLILSLNRDEDPLGEWTIRVSDLGTEGHSGKFLGWSMTLWGSTIDPTKAQNFEVPLIEETLPPLFPSDNDQPADPTTTEPVTKTIVKPTAHLPTDHVEAPGETHKPAFPGSNSTTPQDDEAAGNAEAPSATSTPTADEGWFSDMSNLMTNQVWFFIAAGAVLIFAAGAGLFFWRRSVRRRQNYTSLPADEVAMRNVDGRVSTRSKELYAAFDEEDDEDADEETGLRRAPDQSPVGLGYHSGFLDDDDPASAGGPPTRYKDEPSPAERAAERPHSPEDGSGDSGSGSWEHASQENAPHS